MSPAKSITDHNLGKFMKFLQVMKLTDWSQKETIPREVFHAYLAEIQRKSTKHLTLKEKYQGRYSKLTSKKINQQLLDFSSKNHWLK